MFKLDGGDFENDVLSALSKVQQTTQPKFGYVEDVKRVEDMKVDKTPVEDDKSSKSSKK